MWNAECAEKAGKVFLPVSGEAPGTPDLNVVIINSYMDIVEIEKPISTSKPVVFFFNKYHDLRNSLQVEIDKDGAFKETAKDKGI